MTGREKQREGWADARARGRVCVRVRGKKKTERKGERMRGIGWRGGRSESEAGRETEEERGREERKGEERKRGKEGRRKEGGGARSARSLGAAFRCVQMLPPLSLSKQRSPQTDRRGGGEAERRIGTGEGRRRKDDWASGEGLGEVRRRG